MEADSELTTAFEGAVAESRALLGKAKVSPRVEVAPEQQKAQDKWSERDLKALQHLRRTHGEWDRKLREYNGVLAASAACENTSGTKFEQQLKDLTVDGAVLDKQLLATELSVVDKKALADEEIKSMANICQSIVALLKEANKKAVSLRSWINA